jgi:hypothetical protein
MAHIWLSRCTFGSHLSSGSHTVHEGLPYSACGSHGAYTAPIQCLQLPYGAQVSYMAPMSPVMCPWVSYGPPISHMTPSTSHMAPYGYHLALHGSHKPSASCMVQTAPIWPSYGANRSHMVPYISHTAHMASTWLPYGSHTAPNMANKCILYGPHMVHSAPKCYKLPPTWSQMALISHPPPVRPTQLPNGSHMVPVAPIHCIGTHMSPSNSYLAPHCCHMGTWLPYSSCTAHATPIWRMHSSHMAPIWPPYGE